MSPSKVENFNLFLNALSLEKANELKAKHDAGTLTKEEFEQALVFKDLPLNEGEIQELESDNYYPVEVRLADMSKFNFWNEVIMVSIAFLQDETDKDAFYDKELVLEKIKTIVFVLCIALHQTKKSVLCRPYIDLLKKLVIAYPAVNNPPQDVIDMIEAEAYAE